MAAAHTPVAPSRALARTARPPVRRIPGALVPRLGASLVPAARATVGVAAVAFAAEVALRSVAGGAVSRFLRREPVPAASQLQPLSRVTLTRTIHTEWTVIRRRRRRHS